MDTTIKQCPACKKEITMDLPDEGHPDWATGQCNGCGGNFICDRGEWFVEGVNYFEPVDEEMIFLLTA